MPAKRAEGLYSFDHLMPGSGSHQSGGTEENNPSVGLRLPAPFTQGSLYGGVLTEPGGGVGGAFYASGGADVIVTPDDFSLVPPGGTVSGGEAATALLGRADECRRSTKGARVSGDRSLLNHGVPAALCAVGNKKEMVGPTVPHTECGFPRLRPVAAFLVPARGGNPAHSRGIFSGLEPLHRLPAE